MTRPLPPSVRHGLTQFGRDIRTSRIRRNLTVAMMAERIGVSKTTYGKIEAGDPSVALGSYAMALFALGLKQTFSDTLREGNREVEEMFAQEQLPKRVRVKDEPAW